MKQLYFDSDDDITAIINKLEDIESSKVALIPPKRSTILQSVVNLKLLKKAAGANDNDMVLITKDPVILNVASQLKILTAPNLETEPSVPSPKESTQEMPSSVIDGSQASDKDYKSADKAVASEDKKDEKPKKDKKSLADKKSKKVPDFNRFKKYALIGLAALLLIGGGLWWALFLAPSATAKIEGRTQEVSANATFDMDPEAETSDIENNTLAADLRQESRTLSTTFKPTGTDIIGEKATGEIKITNCDSSDPITIPKGTAITSDEGYVFRNNVAFEVPGATFSGASCVDGGEETATVTADDIGGEYNIGPTSYTVEGYDPEHVDGDGGNMTGGEKEEVTVVSAEDLKSTKSKLLEEERSAMEKTLNKQFDDEQYIVEASFDESVEQTTSEPPVGEQTTEARLILQVTYTLLAAQQEDMKELLAKLYKAESQDGDDSEDGEHEDIPSLGVIEYGLEDLDIQKTDNNTTFSINAKGVLGPDLPEEELKKELAGKTYAEAVEILEGKPNVSKVEVHLSPFWVADVPDNPDKIEIVFEVTQQLPEDDTTGD